MVHRRLRFGYLGAALLGPLAAGCGPAAESAPEATPKDSAIAAAAPADRPAGEARGVILFVGTSLTAGLGLDPDDAYPALIQARLDSLGLPFRAVNAGVSGETSAGALRRIEWLLSQEPPAVIVIETGANDGLRGQSPDSLRSNLEGILDAVDRLDPRPVVFVAAMEAPPNLGQDYVSAFRAVFPEVAARRDATLLPFLLEGVAGVAALNQADGIHPNEAGARRVAENVWQSLRPVLTENGARR